MSFDVFLQRFADGAPAEMDRRSVREVLRSARHRGPDTFGFYVVAFPDGVEVEFSAKGLESEESFTGCAFHLRASGDALMTFMFEIARAGDMVIFPAMEGNPLVLLSEEQRTDLPAELRETSQLMVVRSAAELGGVLRQGLEGWSAYRDHMLSQSKPKQA